MTRTLSPTPRQQLRAILAGDRCVHPASVHDAVSIRMAEDIGFDLAMLGGSVAALAVLGAPDISLLTLSEFAGLCRRICRASQLPLFVDADHGFGNALNVMRTVEEVENAGVAGLGLEDTVLPMAFDESGDNLISIAEASGKLKAAVAARRDPDLVIAGRTMVFADHLDDLKARVTAYSQTGVDAIFLARAREKRQLEAVRASTRLPIILAAARGELTDVDYLAKMGVRICLQGHPTFPAATAAAYSSLSKMHGGSKNQVPDDVMAQASRDADYQDFIRRFLKSE